MARSGGCVLGCCRDQLAPAQMRERGLDGTLGQSSRIRQRSKTQCERFPPVPRSPTIKIEINEIRGRLLVVPKQIAHQNIEDVIIDWDGLFETRHMGRMKAESGSVKLIQKPLYV
jgi:hypothetical protein